MWHIFADELVAPVPCLHDQWLRTFSLNVVGPSHHQGFLCVFSVYYTPFSATSALLGNVDTVAPAAFIRMNCHRWPMVLPPPWRSQTDRSQKVDFWSGQSCVGFKSILQRLYGHLHSLLPDVLPAIYTHHIDNFSWSHSMSNTVKNKFGKILQELFPGVYDAFDNWRPRQDNPLFADNSFKYIFVNQTGCILITTSKNVSKQ